MIELAAAAPKRLRHTGDWPTPTPRRAPAGTELRALQDAGRRVPQDVSVAGHDDLPEAEFVGPGLTTVRPGVDRLAATSVRVLEQLLAREGDVPALTTVVPELVVRGSTGPASW